MSSFPGVFLFGIATYAIVIAVVAVIVYLVLRFAIRDGLRAHTLWLERRASPDRD